MVYDTAEVQQRRVWVHSIQSGLESHEGWLPYPLNLEPHQGSIMGGGPDKQRDLGSAQRHGTFTSF